MMLLIFLFLFLNSQIVEGERTKRSLLSFFNIVRCATGRNPFDYDNYGCWCGKGGSGIPIDHIDRCCLEHDECYRMQREVEKRCNSLTRYTAPYDWECMTESKLRKPANARYVEKFANALNISLVNGSLDEILTNFTGHSNSADHPKNETSWVPSWVPFIGHKLVERQFPICTDTEIDCGSGLCMCDMKAALCFAQGVYPKEKPKCPTKG